MPDKEDMDGIEEISETIETPEIETEPENTPEITPENPELEEKLTIQERMTASDRIRELIQEKINQDKNFKIKDQKIALCKEIANQVQNEFGSCTYQAVTKILPSILKIKKPQKKRIVKSDGNEVEIEETTGFERPPRKKVKEDSETESQTSTKNSWEENFEIMKQMQEKGESIEEMMIKYTLEDVSFFLQALGLKKAQSKRLAISAKKIALYNEMQRQNGKPENCISVSDSLMKPLILLGVIASLIQPTVTAYFGNSKDSDNGITKKSSKSLREKHGV